MIVKAANFLILVVGVALIVVGAIAGSITIAIVGDILAIGGILLFWLSRRGCFLLLSAAPQARGLRRRVMRRERTTTVAGTPGLGKGLTAPE